MLGSDPLLRPPGERSAPQRRAPAPEAVRQEASPDRRTRGRRWPKRVALVVLATFALAGLYYLVTLFQVWNTSRQEQARPVDAIVVLGAAQYDGRPSPVLRARLDHALGLYREGYADTIVVTGGKLPADRFTEAAASARYLIDRGVPDEAILREVQGRSTWESLAATARILKARGLTQVLLVSDPYHSLRIKETAAEVGLDAFASPTRTSPVSSGRAFRHMTKEAAGIAVARLPFMDYRRLLRITG